MGTYAILTRKNKLAQIVGEMNECSFHCASDLELRTPQHRSPFEGKSQEVQQPSPKEGTRESSSKPHLLRTCRGAWERCRPRDSPTPAEKVAGEPKLGKRSLQTFQRQRERGHLPAAEVMISLCSSPPGSRPSIHVPLSLHCFQSLGRRKKPPQSPHSVPCLRDATRAPHKGCRQLQLTCGAPRRRVAGGRRASTRAAQPRSGHTARRGHDQSSLRLRWRASVSSSKKKKKSVLRAPPASRGP